MATHSDWLSLVELSGLVVSEPVLEQHFPGGPTPVNQGSHHWFRRYAERFELAMHKTAPDQRRQGAGKWIDYMLHGLLELSPTFWLRKGDIPPDLVLRLDQFDQYLRPTRVLTRQGDPVLLVDVVPPEQGLDRREMATGRWKASPTTKMDRLLRDTGNPLGLLTNGQDFRLVHARQGLTTGHITWSARLLMEEKAALDSLYTLLGRDLLLPEKNEDINLADLCRDSIDRQGDVADQLGVQVRNGLERLIWAWDAADRDSGGRLLAGMAEDSVYEMGLAVMMRLVFMLYAEERSLLPHGQVLYDQAYGLTYLWHRLQEQHRTSPTRMSETYDAWERFLASCRLIHGGSRHPDLPLIAYGGSLFASSRFAALEDPRCKVSNRVMHELLHLLLFAQQSRGGEPQRVGYWALDVEQIGYVYEGLLDHRCARAGEQPMVKLKGAGEEAVSLADLEAAAGGRPEAGGWSKDEDTDPPATVVELIAGKLYKKPKDEHREKVANRLSSSPGRLDLDGLKRFPQPVAERVLPFASAVQCDEIVPPHWRYLTTGTARRASGAHYTPQSLTERVVRVTLEPQVYRCEEGKPGKYLEPRQVKTPRELLDLKVCDIAMGSGAFLVQAVRYLADRLVEAWDRALAEAQEKHPGAVLSMPYAESTSHTEPTPDRDIDPEHRDEMVLWARRFVAERCIYGVDVNHLAVEMAKLSLWLTTLAKDRAFTFLDHALRCGDTLVGVDEKQLSTWSLDGKGSGAPLLESLIGRKVKQAAELRRQLQQMPVIDADDVRRKARLLDQANELTDRLRLAGDLLIAPSFSGLDSKKQEALRKQFEGKFTAREEDVNWESLRHERNRLLKNQRTFHWPMEFPEVFGRENGGFDAIVGNPPFLGGRRMRSTLGDAYVEWLLQAFPGSSLNADLCAFMFLQASTRVQSTGTFGLLATNTIGQGDTVETGLQRIVQRGGTVYDATPRMPWPGVASVNVSIAHVARSEWSGEHTLDGAAVDGISARLSAGETITTPRKLAASTGSFIGSFVNGMGFVLEPERAHELIRADPRNKDVLFPYLNGKDLNTHPEQRPSRWVINFFDWPLERAKEYLECFGIVEREVYPVRATVRRVTHRKYWWHYGDKRPALHDAIEAQQRVLVTARVTKHLAFSWLPTRQVFNEKTVVFADSSGATFSLLQSTLHSCWTWQFSSTLKTDLNYAPSDCFETFPFPHPDDETQQRLDAIGEEYHEHRRQLMLANDEGLTKTYNRFHAPGDETPGIVRLRELHVEMDHAVRDAYGWSDLDLEHGWLKNVTVAEKKNRKTGKVEKVEKVEWRFAISEKAKEEVLCRLLKLNYERYEEEVRQGLHDKKKGKKGMKAGGGLALRSLGEVGRPEAGGKAKSAGEAGPVERKTFKLSNPVDKKKGPRLL